MQSCQEVGTGIGEAVTVKETSLTRPCLWTRAGREHRVKERDTGEGDTQQRGKTEEAVATLS